MTVQLRSPWPYIIYKPTSSQCRKSSTIRRNRGKFDTPNTHTCMHDSSLSMIHTCTLMKCGEVNLALWEKIFPLSERMWSCIKTFPCVSKIPALTYMIWINKTQRHPSLAFIHFIIYPIPIWSMRLFFTIQIVHWQSIILHLTKQ